MAGIERINIISTWSQNEKRCKVNKDLQPSADETYSSLFGNINMPLQEGVTIHDCSKEDAIAIYDWKEGIDCMLNFSNGHRATVQEKLLTTIYKTVTFTESTDTRTGTLKGNWYTSTAQYWFVAYARSYPESIIFNDWMLIDFPALQRYDAMHNLNWHIRQNNQPGYQHIKFRFLYFDEVPGEVVIGRT